MPSENACGCCCNSREIPSAVLASTRLAEQLIALLEEGCVGPVGGSVRHNQTISLETLQPVLQYRAINFGEHIVAHLDHEVRPDADDVHVEGGMVQFAQRQPVGHGRKAEGMGVQEDRTYYYR